MFSIVDLVGYIPQLITCIASVLITACVVLSWKISLRDPLDFDVYIVETQSNERRKVVQILHLGYEERSFAGSEIMNTLQSSRVFPRIDDVSVVIQSPATIVDAPPSIARRRDRALYLESYRSWMMEIIGESSSRRTNGNGQSGMAAAVAIAVANGRREIHTSEHRILLVDYMRNEERREDREGEELIESERINGIVDSLSIDEVDHNGSESSDEIMPSLSTSNSDSSTNPSPIHRTTSDHNEDQQDNNGEGTVVENGIEDDLPSDTLINIRLKFLDDNERNIEIGTNSTLADLKRRFLEDITSGGNSIRLIYRGQLLRNDSDRLFKVGMENGCVVHVLIGSRIIERREEEGERIDNHPTQQIHPQSQPVIYQHPNESWQMFREIVQLLALVIIGIFDYLANTWLGTARIIRDRLIQRAERGRNEGNQSSYIDRILLWLANSLGVLDRSEGSLRNTPIVSFMLPFIIFIQLSIGWTLVILFPRLFDNGSSFMLILISVSFYYYYSHSRRIS